jgi:hypothetical protein
MAGFRTPVVFAFALASGAIAVAGSEAGAASVPTQSHVVRCLREAGWTTHATTADGATLIVTSSAGITWTISLAPPKPHAGWTGYGKSPNAKQRAIVAGCLK